MATRHIDELLQGYSRGLYANWLWHRALHLLIDAGEGVHLTLGRHVFAPAVVAITHGHSDHVLGLPGLAAARRFGKGATTRPWTVLYPAGATGVEATRAHIDALWRGVDFPITWVPVVPGEVYRLSRERVIEALAADHASESALSYRVLEARRRLKPELAALLPVEIEARARRQGRDHVMETYHHVLFVHSGDTMPIDPAVARGADLLVHDATFLSSADRRVPIHATTDEALAVARDAQVSTLVLHHLSVRYDRTATLPLLRDQVAASGFTGDCWLLDDDRFVRLASRESESAAFAHGSM